MKSSRLGENKKAFRLKSKDGKGSLFRRRALIIFNPVAGYFPSRRLTRVCQSLSWLGVEVTIRETAYRGDAEAFAVAASSKDCDVVVAAGGDGTINEVANGLAGSHLPLAIIPLGTANVLAEEIKMCMDAPSIARTIAAGETQTVTIGRINGRRFLMMAGIGFDAHVVANINRPVKQAVGKLAYVGQTLISAFTFSGSPYLVTVDGVSCEAASAVIANGRSYGGRYTCAPEARLEDPEFHVCLFLNAGPWNTLRYCSAIVLGRIDRLSDIKIVRGSHITVKGADGEPVQCDGDITSHLPLSAYADRDTLNLVMPTHVKD
jgi:YegS/Rv2252/BmrU family lipid kinase